jgi:hypothetical protein
MEFSEDRCWAVFLFAQICANALGNAPAHALFERVRIGPTIVQHPDCHAGDVIAGHGRLDPLVKQPKERIVRRSRASL